MDGELDKQLEGVERSLKRLRQFLEMGGTPHVIVDAEILLFISRAMKVRERKVELDMARLDEGERQERVAEIIWEAGC